ncbi:MAG TPA: hypothetical protein VH231_17725 [Solirubrobacteraceae bacterium]|jgi:hypothetical protein|nr:hypothetical protein [Solirubrobacteraceae bacterium]
MRAATSSSARPRTLARSSSQHPAPDASTARRAPATYLSAGRLACHPSAPGGIRTSGLLLITLSVVGLAVAIVLPVLIITGAWARGAAVVAGIAVMLIG